MGDYIGNTYLDIMSLFLHFKVKITVFTYTVVHPCTPIHLYTCTPIDLYTYTPVHSYALVHLNTLCTCTVAHTVCTPINLYTYTFYTKISYARGTRDN